MAETTGVRLKRAGKVDYFDAAGHELVPGDRVVVETDRGLEVGHVVIAPGQVVESEVAGPLKPVIRKATPEDVQRFEDNKLQARHAVGVARTSVTRLDLPMKLLAGQYTLDRSRLTIFFSAEGRVDFRELVRDLAGRLRTRIELHQVGPREETKVTGGLGRCGRSLCCSSWMAEFNPVNVRMAKEQELPVNQAQLAGTCGRLRCCLCYEAEGYADLQQRTPDVGDQVVTPQGVATVLHRSLLQGRLTVRLPDNEVVEMSLAEVWPPVTGGSCPRGRSCGGACGCPLKAKRNAVPAR